MKTIYDYYNEAVEDFDFEKVFKVMTFLDWKWAEKKVTIDMMKQTVHDLFIDCLSYMAEKHKNTCTCGTGGFEVSTGVNQEDGPFVLIKFVLEDSGW